MSGAQDRAVVLRLPVRRTVQEDDTGGGTLETARGVNPLADVGPDSMTRQAGVAGTGPGPGHRDRAGPASQPVEVLLRVLATTDVHANILSYDYAANRPLSGQGLAQMASLISAARAETPEALLLDNGDFLQGSALAEMAAQFRRRRGHPVIAAMNTLGYDAATLGNHEFNYGIDLLLQALAEARFPAVSANVLLHRGPEGPLGDETLVPPYAMLERTLPDRLGRLHRLRIGVLGLTPPEIMRWDQAHLTGRLDTRPMHEAAQAWVPQMRRAGADLVICLAHTGIAGRADDSREAQAADLAEIPGIDALVLGHSHMVFPHRGLHPDSRVDPEAGKVAGKPAVQPGFAGSHLGVMDLRLRQDSCGGWAVAAAEVRAESVSEVAAGLSSAAIRRSATPLRQAVGGDHRAALAWTRRTLGQTDLPMSTAFAHAADVAALRMVGLAKISYAKRRLAGTIHENVPVLATATPYRSGGRSGPLNYSSIMPGPLSVRHVFDLYPFPNTVMGVLVSGTMLAEQLERAASIYADIIPGTADQPLIDPAFPSYAFTTVLGISYEVDPTRPARYDTHGMLIRPMSRRVRGLRHAGQPVAGDDMFILVTNSYRAAGSLGLTPVAPREIVLDRHELCTDTLCDFIRQQGRIGPQTLAMAESWQLRSLPGTSVLLDTGADAGAFTEEICGLRPVAAGLTSEGFHRFRLHL